MLRRFAGKKNGTKMTFSYVDILYTIEDKREEDIDSSKSGLPLSTVNYSLNHSLV